MAAARQAAKDAAKALSGMFPVYKPRGVTSADVVAVVRSCIEDFYGLGTSNPARISIQGHRPWRKPVVKVGHGGTLDPLAEGVLVISLGDSCRDMPAYLSGSKVYVAVGQLGVRTDTGDVTGQVVHSAPFDNVTLTELRGALPQFTGSILQTPPVFSALKHNGQRLCDLARAGKADTVEVSPRPIMVHYVDVVAPSHVAIPLGSGAAAAGPGARGAIVDGGCEGGAELFKTITGMPLARCVEFQVTNCFLPAADERARRPLAWELVDDDGPRPSAWFGLRAVVSGGTCVELLLVVVCVCCCTCDR
jgi:tRNA pseudouridine55 synthase